MVPAPCEILLVEDDDDIRDSLHELLEQQGYRVISARNGREAFAVLDRIAPPKLILLDLMMPEMDGPEFLGLIRKHEQLHRVPIVILTAWMSRWSEVVEGADDAMQKPINTDRLMEVVKRYVGRGPESGGRSDTDAPSGPVPPKPSKRPGMRDRPLTPQPQRFNRRSTR